MYSARTLVFLSLLALATTSAIPIHQPRALTRKSLQPLYPRTNTTTTGTNIQNFNSSLGGFTAPPVLFDAGLVDGGRPYTVGDSTFLDAETALTRSCAEQHNECADGSNDGATGATVAECDAQQESCVGNAQSLAADTTDFPTSNPSRLRREVGSGSGEVEVEVEKRDGGKFRVGSEKAVPTGSEFEEGVEKRADYLG